jgi:hypothetical protein
MANPEYTPPPTCPVPGCAKVRAEGHRYCSTHYHRVTRYGSFDAPRRTSASERFLSKVEKTPTCWLWRGAINWCGYGRLWIEGHTVMAHRFAYELFVGPIPAGLDIDHVRARGCTNRHCVNPAHLEAVTRRENTLRSTNVVARNAVKTHCRHGHEYTPENTYFSKKQRHCRTCRLIASRRHEAVRVRSRRKQHGR